MNPGHMIEVRGVEKRYGRRRALDGVNLVADVGVTGLLGRNGAGKTTLLRILATVAAPDRGEVRLLGADPADPLERVEIRRRLGYLPQEVGFYRSFTAFEFVDYVAILKQIDDRRTRREEVRRVLDAVGLAAESHRRVRSLSAGMRQRLGIAQALLGEPHLLVLDEPTAGLDPEQRLRFRDLVSRVGESRTVVVSTHQTEDVVALCRQVVVLDRGRVRFHGTPAQLIATAEGRVWLTTDRDPEAELAWRTSDGLSRNLGVAPVGAELCSPTIDDAYLLLLGAERARVESLPR